MGAATVLGAPLLAAADEAAIAEATADLDALEARLAGLPPGDIPAANELTKALNSTTQKIGKLRGKIDPNTYNGLVRRANALAPQIQARAREKPPAGAPPAGTPGAPGAPASPTAPPAAGSAVAQALAEIERVEQALPTQAKGDKPRYDELMGILREASKKLTSAQPLDQRTAAQERLRAVKAKLEAAYRGEAAPAAARLSNSQKTALKEWSSALGVSRRSVAREEIHVFATDPARAAAQREQAAAARAALARFGPADHPELAASYQELSLYDQEIEAYLAKAKATQVEDVGAVDAGIAAQRAALEAGPATELAAPGADQPYRGAIAAWRLRLSRYTGPDQSAVGPARERIAAFERDLDARLAAGRAERDANAATAAKDVEDTLARLEQVFDRDTFSCVLEPPYSEERVSDWVKKLKGWMDARQGGVRMLDDLCARRPEYAADPRVVRLRRWFAEELDARIQDGIGRAATSYRVSSTSGGRGAWPGAIEAADRWIWDPITVREDKLTDERHVAKVLATCEECIVACKALLVFRRDFEGKDDPELAKKLVAFQDLIVAVQGGAEQALKNVRMPKPKSTDAAMAAIVAETLAADGRRPLRTVLFSEAIRSAKQWDWQGNTLYLYDWDELYAWTAEEVDGAHWTVQYRLRFYRSGDLGCPTGRWFISSRIQSQKILPENIDR